MSIDLCATWLSESEQTGIFSILEAISHLKATLTCREGQARKSWEVIKEILSDVNYL